MSLFWIILAGLAYLALLFGIANYTDKRRPLKGKVFDTGIVYALSLGAYCTAWTYYGSVGRAASTGIDFVTVYLGPTILAGLFWPVLRRMVRISKVLRLTSIADFISTRYGKNFSLGIIVTLVCVVGIVPYISLQIKAIVSSIEVLQQGHAVQDQQLGPVAIGAALVLFVFSVLYGARSVDAAEKHEGLVAAIAFESIVKLLAFIAVGLYVCFGLFDGFGDLFSKVRQAGLEKLFVLDDRSGYAGWTAMTLLSMGAILFLPRQFQVGVVENVQEAHLKTASWMFPFYLFLINLFVLPIAFGGLLLVKGNADNFVLTLPLQQGNSGLALFAWIGGLSAATSMIILETIALSIMISNNLVMPLLFSASSYPQKREGSVQRTILLIRRLSIGLVMAMALVYFEFLGKGQSLVSIGLISFCAVAQFAPALIGGMYWRNGSKLGAVSSILVGFGLWVYTLILPNLVSSGVLPQSLLTEGPWGMSALRPAHLFNLEGFDLITHSVFWSLLFNGLTYVIVSMYSNRKPQEIYQAELFRDIFKHSTLQEGSIVWKGTVYMKDLKKLLGNFVGEERAANLITAYGNRHRIQIHDDQVADARMVNFTERVLGGVVGQASARIIMQSAAKEEEISIEEVLHILRENQQMIEMNKELRRKSQELSKATALLKQVNEQLKETDQQKDEFLYTVTHELRTPLTSIRALSEIVHDNPDMDEDERKRYLDAVIRETERLSHLITQVLNLEKYESGRQRLNIAAVDLGQLIREVALSMDGLLRARNLRLSLHLTDSMLLLPCDRDLISQVVINLLGNAIKFARTEIRIHAHFNQDEWQIWVTDDGAGVEPALREQIFDKFFQARNQTLKKPEGSGLGLAICRKIVELHGGRIWVESEPGKGADFVFTLPTELHPESLQ